MAEALLRLAGDPALRARLAQGAYEMSRRYSIEKMVDSTLAAYDKIGGHHT
jgi:glycosyltransferase involved in cell wall biosynthesis